MREILFRAKDLRDKWRYGYYDGSADDPALIDEDNETGAFWIKGETLGEFTGRYDKDGVRIFEGDIVRLSLLIAKDLTYTTIGKIVYNGSCAFVCETISKKVGTFPLAPDFKYEVLGNIYDNPELLKKNE